MPDYLCLFCVVSFVSDNDVFQMEDESGGSKGKLSVSSLCLLHMSRQKRLVELWTSNGGTL